VLYSTRPNGANVNEQMDASAWFQTQLRAGAEGFAWAVSQVPAERRLRAPPEGLGEWTLARHVFHLLFYEREVALPSMRLWLGETPKRAAGPDEDVAWDPRAPVDGLLAEFQHGRAAQIELLPQLPATAWGEPRATRWGDQTLHWVMTKTYQHTAEHLHDVLSLALFWDAVEAYHRRR
jgi:hypothetical protein